LRLSAIGGLLCALVLTLCHDLHAATANTVVTVSARVNSQAKIILSTNALNFVTFYHEFEDIVTANENPVSITAKARTGSSSTVTLTFLAADDLRSTHQTIPISNITWTSTGDGFQNGTMSKTTPQTVGRWTGAGSHSGTLSFSLQLTNQNSAEYTSSGTFTLIAP
jgi:hypothetical protein